MFYWAEILIVMDFGTSPQSPEWQAAGSFKYQISKLGHACLAVEPVTTPLLWYCPSVCLPVFLYFFLSETVTLPSFHQSQSAYLSLSVCMSI